MDTSETYRDNIVNPLEPLEKIEVLKWYEDPVYIKQCDCEEIQGEHELESGDFFYQRLKKAQLCGYIQGVHIEENCNDYGSLVEPNGAKLVWLPRQDQLQEMITVSHKEDYNRSMYPTLERLWEFSCTLYLMKFPPTSMEQLWLAFVMKEKFNQTWDGDKWA